MPEPSGEFVGAQDGRSEVAGFPATRLVSKSPSSTIAASVFGTQSMITLKSMKIKPTRKSGAVFFKVVIFTIRVWVCKGGISRGVGRVAVSFHRAKSGFVQVLFDSFRRFLKRWPTVTYDSCSPPGNFLACGVWFGLIFQRESQVSRGRRLDGRDIYEWS